jgi:hypothetical protein
MSSAPDKGKPEDVVQSDNGKKEKPPVKLEQIFNEKNIAKYIPKQLQGVQSEKNTHEMDRDLLIVILIVAILLLIALLGEDLIWLLFVALLVILIYVLIKYLGVFN